jgi:hypothetical protein
VKKGGGIENEKTITGVDDCAVGFIAYCNWLR